MFDLNKKQLDSLEKGINVHKLKAGTILFVVTKNNLYKLVKTKEDRMVIAEGGKLLGGPTEVVFSGSTFGGSMIKIGWIGHGMFMEMYVLKEKRRIKTSYVKSARIIGDGWEYDMDWEEE